MYLEASTDWQLVCEVVPGGLGLPYSQATMDAFPGLVKDGRIAAREEDLPSVREYIDAKLADLKCLVQTQFDKVNARLDGQECESF